MTRTFRLFFRGTTPRGLALPGAALSVGRNLTFQNSAVNTSLQSEKIYNVTAIVLLRMFRLEFGLARWF